MNDDYLNFFTLKNFIPWVSLGIQNCKFAKSIFYFFKKSTIRVAIYNSLWPDISRFFFVDLITSRHFSLMENVNEKGKERDGPLVYPGTSLHTIPSWDDNVYKKIIVIFSSSNHK